jgi:hypothetical protein
VFPVRYDLNFYISFRRNQVSKGLRKIWHLCSYSILPWSWNKHLLFGYQGWGASLKEPAPLNHTSPAGRAPGRISAEISSPPHSLFISRALDQLLVRTKATTASPLTNLSESALWGNIKESLRRLSSYSGTVLSWLKTSLNSLICCHCTLVWTNYTTRGEIKSSLEGSAHWWKMFQRYFAYTAVAVVVVVVEVAVLGVNGWWG